MKIRSEKNGRTKELCMFSETDMAGCQVKTKRNNDDLEIFTDAVVDALKVLEGLDKRAINQIAEECYYNSLENGFSSKKIFYLHSLPGYFFDIVQYSALEYCVQQIAIPIYRWTTLMPEGCYERGIQLYKQQTNNTKKE